MALAGSILVRHRAQARGASLSDLVNQPLRKDIELIEAASSPAA